MTDKQLDLRSFKIPLGKLAPRESFRTRQGTLISYRLYPAWSEDLIVLYHGVGSDSKYMCVLASALAAAGVATVVTPDFRGHGESLGVSDQISPSQLIIDLEELLIHIKIQRAVSRVCLAGHSLGGGFALKVATSDIRKQFYKFIALAPYLPPSLGCFRENFGGWVTPHGDGFSVNMPELFRTGQEKLTYSADYIHAAAPSDNILKLLNEYRPPVQVLVGAEDEVLLPSKQQELFNSCGVQVQILSNLNHLSIVTKPQSYLTQF